MAEMTMMANNSSNLVEAFKSHIREEVGSSEETLDKITACMKPEKAKRNTILLAQGDI